MTTDRKTEKRIAGVERRPRSRLVVLALGVALSAHACAGPPWYMGEPLGGRPAIPPTTRAKTVAQHRGDAEAARDSNDRVAEIASLHALELRGALRQDEEKRFVELLALRARDWSALGRPIPLADDLRHIVELWPSRALPLGPRLRNAELAAGDLWLGLGQNARAEAEYRDAEKLGAEWMDVRFRAVWGASVADLDDAALEWALSHLPPRVLAPFSAQYLDRAAPKTRLLRRAWVAARTYGPQALLARIETLPSGAAFVVEGEKDNDGDVLGAAETTKTPPAAPSSDDLLSSGPTLARALLPVAAAFPGVLDPGPRSRLWADRLLAEDPTSPDSLEVAALIDARAGRLGGAEEKLVDLVFFSVDRAAGYGRAARVWERVGQVRRACVAWEHATGVGPADDPRWCALLACVQRDDRTADAVQVRAHIQARAPRLACVAPPAPGDAGAAGDEVDRAATDDGGAPDGGGSN